MPKGVYIRTEETRKKMSLSRIGKKRLPFSDEAKKNMSLGRKGIKLSKEHCKNISDSLKGRIFTEEWKNKISLVKKGKSHPYHKEEKHPMWKEIDYGYNAVHNWVRKYKNGYPKECEHCGKSGLTSHKIHWANIDHKYRRVLKDYIGLCAKCHRKYDIEMGFVKVNTKRLDIK